MQTRPAQCRTTPGKGDGNVSVPDTIKSLMPTCKTGANANLSSAYHHPRHLTRMSVFIVLKFQESEISSLLREAYDGRTKATHLEKCTAGNSSCDRFQTVETFWDSTPCDCMANYCLFSSTCYPRQSRVSRGRPSIGDKTQHILSQQGVGKKRHQSFQLERKICMPHSVSG